jgi:dihydrofolate reductase
MAENRVIGRKNALPWHLPTDMRRFKALTMGHTLIMGRKTFDAIGKPLPGRRTIVLTRDPGREGHGIEIAPGLDRAIELTAGEAEVFIAGGADVYRQALPRATRIYLTVVHAQIDGDAYFPSIDPAEWVLAAEERHAADAQNAYELSFCRYERAQE